MHKNLGSFIQLLKENNELVQIDTLVDAHLEIAEIHRRVIAAGGPALLFTNVKGKDFPVVTNLFGTEKRVDMAFGQAPERFIERVARLPHELFPPSFSKLFAQRDLLFKLPKLARVRKGPVMEREVAPVDLTRLPALTSWEEDGGPFLTLPIIHTEGIKKPSNIGMYRIQIFEEKETGLHFQIGKGSGFHLWEKEQVNEDLKVNLYLGGPPSLILSAIAPLPENVPELLLAAMVYGKKLELIKAEEGEIDPIAEAEFFIKGYSPCHVRRDEGPFGDHYGYYSLVHKFPVFRAEKLYHRKGAVFPATVVGKPRQEDYYLGNYLQRLLSPIFPVVMPSVEDLWSYGETGYHALSAAVLKERYKKEALGSAFRILGEGQLSLTKFLIGIDKKIDLKDFRGVLKFVLERVSWEEDLYIFAQTSMDTLDYAGPKLNRGSKGVLLAMGEAKRILPSELPKNLPFELIKNHGIFIPGCLVVESASFTEDKEAATKIAKLTQLKDWPMIVVVDSCKRALLSEAAFLWTTFTRFDPASDIHPADKKIINNQVCFSGPIVIDARMKPWYPKELFTDEKTNKTVSERWLEYFPSGKISMGESQEINY